MREKYIHECQNRVHFIFSLIKGYMNVLIFVYKFMSTSKKIVEIVRSNAVIKIQISTHSFMCASFNSYLSIRLKKGCYCIKKKNLIVFDFFYYIS